jgi:hypothetical protein
MMGMELLMKSMLGVEPEEIKKTVEDFMAGINNKMQQGVESYKAIEARLDSLEAHLVRIEGLLNHVADAINASETSYVKDPLLYNAVASAHYPVLLSDVDAIHGPVNGGS